MICAPFQKDTLFSEIHIFDERHLALAKNSFLLAAGTTGLSLLIGVPLAFLLGRTDLWGRRLFGILYLVPVLIPPYIHAIIWTHVDGLLKNFTFFDIYNLKGAIFVMALAYYPFVTLLTLSGLKSVDRNLEEASLLNHKSLYTLRHVTFPLLMPHILSGAIFVFIFSLIDFGVPDILRVNVYPVEIFIQFSAFYDEKAAILLSFPLIVIALLLVLLQKWHMGKRSYINLSSGLGKGIMYYLGKLNILSFMYCFIVFSLSALVPVTVLIKTAGALSNYLRVINTSLSQIGYSLVMAALGGLLTLFLSFSISYIIERTKNKSSLLLEFASYILFVVPATAVGIGLIEVWNRPLIDSIYKCPVIIILGYIAHSLPFTIRATSSGIKQISPSLEEAAFLTTTSRTKVISKILIPLLTPSLMAGFFIAFILSFGELGTTLLVIPPGMETIPIKIYNLMHYGADQMIAALCMTLIFIIFILSGIFMLLYKNIRRLHAVYR